MSATLRNSGMAFVGRQRSIDSFACRGDGRRIFWKDRSRSIKGQRNSRITRTVASILRSRRMDCWRRLGMYQFGSRFGSGLFVCAQRAGSDGVQVHGVPTGRTNQIAFRLIKWPVVRSWMSQIHRHRSAPRRPRTLYFPSSNRLSSEGSNKPDASEFRLIKWPVVRSWMSQIHRHRSAPSADTLFSQLQSFVQRRVEQTGR